MLISRYLRFPRYFIIHTHTHTHLFIFDCAGSSLLLRLFSGYGEPGCFSCFGAQPLGMEASVVAAWGSVVAPPQLWSAGSAAVGRSRSCSVALWDPPRSGIEPVSPALAGGFFTPEPPGKPDILLLLILN